MEACQELPYLRTGAATPFTYSFGEYDWDPGFRLNAYYQSDCSGWDANVAFTWFSSELDERHTWVIGDYAMLRTDIGGATAGEAAEPPSEPVNGEIYTFTNDLDYYTVDALLGHRCCVCPGFEVRPYGGLRVLSVEQNSVQDLGVDADVNHRHDIEFQAYGLTGGVETKCTPCNCFCDDLSLYGKVGGSIVGGDKDHHYRAITTSTGAVTTSTTFNGSCHTSFGYELALGMTYDHCVCDKWVSLGVGYEMTHWTNVGNPIVNTNESLTLHGLTVRGSVTF
jgi:hypothetical protein